MILRRFRSLFLVVSLLVGFIPAAGLAADGATLTFRKIFKSSYPEYIEIKISESGTGTWDIRQLDEEGNPQPLQVGRPLVQRLFGLAAQLHDFNGVVLDVHRRIANLGQKTFRYEKGGEAHEVSFNYTLDSTANQLLEIFEGLALEEEDLSALQRAMRYDRLGVNEALVRLEADYNRKAIPEPGRLLVALDQLAADDHYLDIARQRARTLAGRIRNSR